MKIILEPDEDGSWHAFVPELPGVHTFGADGDEAYERALEAIEVYLEDAAEVR